MSKDTNFTGRYFVTSDLHVGHQAILQYCPGRGATVEEMNETIVRNWNNLITQEDKVIIVGDVAMGQIEKAPPLIRRLNGKKILVRGNHDKTLCKMIFADQEQYGDLFETITFQYEMTHKVDDKKHQLVFAHFPFAHFAGQDRGVINFHGHLHRNGAQRFISPYRQMDIGMDGNNLTPYLLNDAIRLVRGRLDKPHHHE
jgi:calcineurin-like phosphoesterase family protein